MDGDDPIELCKTVWSTSVSFVGSSTYKWAVINRLPDNQRQLKPFRMTHTFSQLCMINCPALQLKQFFLWLSNEPQQNFEN